MEQGGVCLLKSDTSHNHIALILKFQNDICEGKVYAFENLGVSQMEFVIGIHTTHTS